jgi:hypothetical protein
MAVGDVYVKAPESVSDQAYLDLQPSSGVEIVIHNFGYAGAMELYLWDGADRLKMDEDATAGSRMGVFLHCTNTVYYQIKNVSGGSVLMGADGITTKSA